MRLTISLVLSLALSASACTRSDHTYEQPRLVLLYMNCTLNKDFLQPYNDAVVYTPALAEFAKDSTVFERHQTEAGWSAVAFASVFTGAQAPYHRIFEQPSHLREEAVSIAEVFDAAGYDTFSWLNHALASASLGFAQGVDSRNRSDHILLAGDPRFGEMLVRLRDDPEYKAFVYTNFTITHDPYAGLLVAEFCETFPGECTGLARDDFDFFRAINKENQRDFAFDFADTAERLRLSPADVERMVAVMSVLYKADVYRLDKMFGALVAEIDSYGLRDQSLIAFTSDHGEVHVRDGAYFRWTHGYELRAEVTSVPLLLRGPGAGVPGGRYTGVTRSIDVLPTLTSLADVSPSPEVESAWRGTDVSAAVVARESAPELDAFSHTPNFRPAIRTRRMPLIAKLFPTPEPENMWVALRRGDTYAKHLRRPDEDWSTAIYDLAADPYETDDLFDADDFTHRDLDEALRAYKNELVETFYAERTKTGLSRHAATELLRSMGYVD